MVNYYGKFLPNLATTLAPLYGLIKDRARWIWGKPEEAAFSAVKAALSSELLLVYFDPAKPLILACDASPVGVGAVLSHRMKDGSDLPIAFASRTLTPAERNYSQLEKEGLAIIFGTKKFHQYLLGHHFVVHSDHQPLKYLFGETRAIPVLASSRIQRWALILSSYSYSVQYKPGRQLANADALSRLPLDPHSEAPAMEGDVLLLRDHLEGSVVTSKQIQQWTSKDPIMATVRKFTLQGWPESNQQRELQPFFNRHHELTVMDGCVLWGARIVVPPPGCPTVLKELHDARGYL